MSQIQKAFESGDFRWVQQLAVESRNPKEKAYLEKIAIDPKVYLAGAFGLASLILACIVTLCFGTY